MILTELTVSAERIYCRSCCGRGGIGRRARFRFLCPFRTWRFDSSRPHFETFIVSRYYKKALFPSGPTLFFISQGGCVTARSPSFSQPAHFTQPPPIFSGGGTFSRKITLVPATQKPGRAKWDIAPQGKSPIIPAVTEVHAPNRLLVAFTSLQIWP